MRSRPVLAGVGVGLAAVLLLAGGCRADAPTMSPTSVPASSAASSLTSSPEQEALSAYRGMWAAFVEAGKTANPDAPDLRKYTSDDALKLIVNALVVNQSKQEVALGDVVLDPKVTEVKSASEVAITDCVDARNWLTYKASGGLVDDEPGAKHKTTATVKLTPDGWKVSAFVLLGGGTC